MSTPHITQTEIANGKFSSVKDYFTPDALALINRSELMKSMVREYESSTKTDRAVLWTGLNVNRPGF